MKYYLSLYIVLGTLHVNLCKNIAKMNGPAGSSSASSASVSDMETSGSGYVFTRTGRGLGRYGSAGGLGSSNFGSAVGGGFGTSGISLASSNVGFNYPTRYAVGNIGNIGGGLSNVGYQTIGDIGEELDYSSGNLVIPGGSYGYGISKNGLGLGGLGVGTGSGIYRVGGITGSGQIAQPISTLGLSGQTGGGVISESNFKKGEGAKFKAEEEAAEGAEGVNGYKVAEDFDKGQKGAIEKAQQSGQYHTKGGSKKGDEEEKKKYEDSQAASKGHKGEAFGKSEGHKKGHKTSGYHNVYHKDEYKKDTSFYDDEHESHHEEEYGAENAEHAEAKGAKEKAEKIDATYHEDEKSKKGFFTNGHQYGGSQGHDREGGQKEEYGKKAEYANEAKHKEANEVGESSGSSYLKKII